jgi:hypothetical protein
MTEERTSQEAPGDVHALLERIEEAWRELFAALDDIPEDQMSQPGVIGDWSMKDLNEADHAARRDHTLPEQRSAMHQAHAALVERLESVAGIEAARIDEAIRVDTYEHYRDHIKDIQYWRQRAGI